MLCDGFEVYNTEVPRSDAASFLLLWSLSLCLIGSGLASEYISRRRSEKFVVTD